MTAPAALYVGRTVHTRLKPFKRRFAYRLASLLADIDRLEETGRLSPLLSFERFNLFSVYRRDFGPRADAPLRPWAEARFAEAGVDLDGGAIKLFALPRVLGYVFNPLSIWFGYGPDGALRGVIYEVHNTFRDRHAYVARAVGAPTERHAAAKVFHVSPFFPDHGRYDFTLTPPGEGFALAIGYAVQGEDVFAATQTAARKPVTTARLAGLFLALPLMTLTVTAAIHWQALRIWMAGGRYHRRPEAPRAASLAVGER